MTPHGGRGAVVVAAALSMCAAPAGAQDMSFGQRLFQEKADCQFCHGVNGDGHGDPRSPGKAPDLHKTRLDREQLIEVIACGRPGSEMPHILQGGRRRRNTQVPRRPRGGLARRRRSHG